MKLGSGLKTAGVWLWKAITAPLVGELVALALPSILIVLRQGLQVFGDKYPLPVWGISLGSGVVLFGMASLVYQGLKIRALRQRFKRQETIYHLHGLEWILTPAFWLNYQQTKVGDATSALLKAFVIGPFCVHCKTDVEGDLYSDCLDLTCSACGGGVDPRDLPTDEFGEPLSGSALVTVLRENVYRTAQGAARRGDIKPAQ